MELGVELDVDDGQAGPQDAQRHEGGAVGSEVDDPLVDALAVVTDRGRAPTVVAKVAKMKPRKKKGMSLRAFIMLMTMA